MPIDDALEDLKKADKDKGKEKKKKEEKKKPEPAPEKKPDYLTPWHEDVMKPYLGALESRAKDMHDDKFDLSVVKLYAPWIRLDDELRSKICPIPKKRVIELFKERCESSVGELMENSDFDELLEKELEDPFFVHESEFYVNIPNALRFKETMGLYSADVFNTKLGYDLVIPDLNYLSLFVEDGATLREYAKMFYKSHKRPTWSNLVSISQDNRFMQTDLTNTVLFDTESLAKFCKSTGTKKISGAVREAEEIMQQMAELSNAHMQNSHDIQRFRQEYLFKKLIKYNPDLAVEK
jgi:hypothetical protein